MGLQDRAAVSVLSRQEAIDVHASPCTAVNCRRLMAAKYTEATLREVTGLDVIRPHPTTSSDLRRRIRHRHPELSM